VDGALLADVVREALTASQGEGGRLMAVVEKVWARPGQGMTSTFSFGLGYGTLLGGLAPLGCGCGW
jgi:hypothetical protein